MRMSDIVSHLNLAVYPSVALVIFLAVFAAVAVRAWRRPREEMDRLGRMPIEDEPFAEKSHG